MTAFNEQHPILKHLNPEEIESLKILNRMYSKDLKGPQFATGKIVHIWGQFGREIPKKFQPPPNKGHQYIKFKTKEEAEEACQELRKYIFEKWPDTVEWASDDWYRWLIPNGLKQLTLEFKAK